MENNDNFNIEKDKIIKRYFSRIFTVLDEKVRSRLLNLELPEKELKKIAKELAFLPKQEQLQLLEELAHKD